MSTSEAKVDIRSGVLFNTLYSIEEFTFTWRISNYSKIFNDVYVDFSTASNSTNWTVRFSPCNFINKDSITLIRSDDGCCVSVQFKSLVKSLPDLKKEGTFESKAMHTGYAILIIPSYYRENSYHNKELENDMLEFQCNLTILGHTITEKIPLPGCATISHQIGVDLEKLLHSKEHCDMALVVGKNKIPVHKLILRARSSVFNVMFQHNMLENKNHEVEIKDIDFDILQSFIDFLYSGMLKELTWDKAMKLYYAADKYDVTELQRRCSQYLQYNLSVNEACRVLQLADQHKDDELKKSVIHFVRMHAASVKLSESWMQLAETHPKLVAECLQ